MFYFFSFAVERFRDFFIHCFSDPSDLISILTYVFTLEYTGVEGFRCRYGSTDAPHWTKSS